MSLSSSAPWRRYYGDLPQNSPDPGKTMYQLLSEAARRYPELPALWFHGSCTAYSTLMARVDAAARAFCALGIGNGDRVTLALPNCPQVVSCLYGLNRIGAVANMIHPLSAPGEIAFYLTCSESKAILTLDRFYDKVAAALPQVAQPCQVLLTGIGLPRPGGKQVCQAWRRALSAGKGITLPAQPGDGDDPALILYSGGTTGKPKGVVLSSRNLNAMALQTIAAAGFGDLAGMKMLSLMPNFHGFGLGVGIHTALICGAGCILVPRFSAKRCARLLLRRKPNIVPGVPALFEALLREDRLKGKDLSFLKGVFSGGDSLSPALKGKMDAFLREHNCHEQIREGYGTTECVAASCLTPRRFARPGSIGLPYPDTFYKIVTPGTTAEVSPLTEGEICISGPTVMLGYLNDPQETKAALQRHADGKIWLHTGDLGAMDRDGFVYFRQRLKRLIVTCGYNVYPSQLENILESHEKVARCCVIGVPDDYRGQRVRAYIVPAPGVQPSESLKQEILGHCALHIAKFALPREVEFRTELPMTPVGKVAYRVLERQALEETT